MSDPFVTIDLHGMMRAEAMKTVDRALPDAGPTVCQLRPVHGYHRGMRLRSMIQAEYHCHDRAQPIMPGDNPGVTVLVMRALY